MPAPAYFLGIDVARTGLGLVIVANDGSVVASLRRAYGGVPGEPMDPQDWWRAARTGIKEILRRASLKADQVRCIGVTGDEGLVALDRTGKVLCTATLGADPRAEEHVEALTKVVGARNLLNLASGPATSAAAAVKLMWLRDNEKRVWHDLHYALPAKDFLRYRLTETLITDACDASATLLFNPKTRSWSKQLAQLVGVNSDWLPTVANGPAMSGRVTEAAARDAGLSAGTPVVTGAGHAAAIAIAAGVLAPGAMAIELGGNGACFAPTAEAARDPQGLMAASCHTLANVWALTSSSLAGAVGLDWIMDQVLPNEVAQARRNQRDPLDLLAELASEVPTGAEGLVYVPPTARSFGGYVGLKPRHGRGHLARAVMEGDALTFRQTLSALTDAKRQPTRIVVTGPGAANHLWCQILADALDHQIHAAPVAECGAVGAAILAASAVGVFKTVEDACAKLVKAKHTFSPRRAAADTYAALAPAVARLPSAIANAFHPQAAEASA